MELWIPTTTKLACREAAKRRSATMDTVAGEVLAEAFEGSRRSHHRRSK
jgi:hypothetical protein